ncbi:MAG TPA: hypothetical protein VJ842_18420 [Pyrinomonadaceae bacterium]|nr:hypothetical protein [Pyrinomonadaceae bacterium]
MVGMFEYRICNVQQARVTFVNGEWQGHIAVTDTTADDNAKMESCDNAWDYLYRAGLQGWELVSVVAHGTPELRYEVFYLKRAL